MIDTNILLRPQLKEAGWETCSEFLRKMELGEMEGTVADFSIDSAVLIMENHHVDSYRISRFLNSFAYYKGLGIYEITIDDRLEACEHMRNHQLDYDDSIILQSMFSKGITDLVSFDPDFDRVKEIRRLEPKDILAQRKEG